MKERMALAFMYALFSAGGWVVALLILKWICGDVSTDMIIATGVITIIFDIYIACARFGRCE